LMASPAGSSPSLTGPSLSHRQAASGLLLLDAPSSCCANSSGFHAHVPHQPFCASAKSVCLLHFCGPPRATATRVWPMCTRFPYHEVTDAWRLTALVSKCQTRCDFGAWGMVALWLRRVCNSWSLLLWTSCCGPACLC
jgi:hypothetical protein